MIPNSVATRCRARPQSELEGTCVAAPRATKRKLERDPLIPEGTGTADEDHWEQTSTESLAVNTDHGSIVTSSSIYTDASSEDRPLSAESGPPPTEAGLEALCAATLAVTAAAATQKPPVARARNGPSHSAPRAPEPAAEKKKRGKQSCEGMGTVAPVGLHLHRPNLLERPSDKAAVSRLPTHVVPTVLIEFNILSKTWHSLLREDGVPCVQWRGSSAIGHPLRFAVDHTVRVTGRHSNEEKRGKVRHIIIILRSISLFI